MHDDLDLAVGRVKLKHGGSSGGHRGVSSCEYNLGTADKPFQVEVFPCVEDHVGLLKQVRI